MVVLKSRASGYTSCKKESAVFKKSGLIFLLFLGIVLCASQVSAENGWQYWKKGEVTKSPWTEGQFSKIEINEITYTFMPKAPIRKVARMRNGGFNENKISLYNVLQYQDVEMLVQGFRIYQLKVMP